jgi:[acyl-carrier-protein] S-malonyltransferase
MPEAFKAAYVFPGQGSQEVGMGKQLYDKYSEARDIFDTADRVLGFSLSALCFNGPEDELTKTINVQPAILTASIACLAVARKIGGSEFPAPVYVAGHSVGEYSALVANGILSFEKAVALVRIRGKLMQEAGQSNPGAMAAVIGADEKILAEICQESGAEISNINSPGQIVISGSKDAIDRAKIIAESKGIRRMIPLKVSGAFHSRLMQTASDGLKPELEKIEFNRATSPFVSNVTGSLLGSDADIASELYTQITKCVQWQKSIETMIANGINTFIEFGHGQVIAGLIKRINPTARVYNISDVDTENQISAMIKL